MTVQELIETLQDFDPNMKVKFAYNFGDYWRTEVAREVNDVEYGETRFSDYHRMHKVVQNTDDEDMDDVEMDDENKVVILR
jgi:hypothetical protein